MLKKLINLSEQPQIVRTVWPDFEKLWFLNVGFYKIDSGSKRSKVDDKPFKPQYPQKTGQKRGGGGTYKRKFTVTHVHDGESAIPPPAASL